MAKPPDPLADYICDQLRDWAPVAARRLFGSWGIYRGPVMFGLIARDAIYFRVDERNRPDYAAAATRPFLHTARRRAAGLATESSAGAKPFTYTMPNGKTIEMAYYEVPADVLEDLEELPRWAEKAFAAAREAKAAKQPKAAAAKKSKTKSGTPAKAKRAR
jgi:DNA transformation protein and related proteins